MQLPDSGEKQRYPTQELASGVAHDVNNLLAGILASAEVMLAEGTSSSPEVLRIKTSALRAGEIVRQLMNDVECQPTAFEPVNVSSLAHEMLQLLQVSISKHVTLKTDLSPDVPAALANAVQLRQMVMNLVTNAAEAIGDKEGVIHVTTAEAGDYVKLAISDSGAGMTPEVQARIFDAKFTTKATGHGLGMATVLTILQGHGGHIDVVSSIGRGTRVEVLLPCTNQRAEDFSSGTVLVVEDEEALRLAVSKMLRKEGFSVIEAVDGGEGVALFRAHQPEIEVVLLDMSLPVVNGPEVLAELRRVRSGVKVILTSAYGEETFGGMQSCGFIRKPYRLNDLLSVLREARPRSGASSARGAG